MNTTAWVHPDAPRLWGYGCVRHVYAQVAFVKVLIVGISDEREYSAQCIEQFIESQGWLAKVVIDNDGEKFRNKHLDAFGRRVKMKPGTNGLRERSSIGGSVNIIWPWEQVIDWLSTSWPTRGSLLGTVKSDVGAWCYAEGFGYATNHISQDKANGWPCAKRQMRSLGIHKDVIELSRQMNDSEKVDAMCGAIKSFRYKLEEIHN